MLFVSSDNLQPVNWGVKAMAYPALKTVNMVSYFVGKRLVTTIL
jgi:hypothetical protein